MRVKYTELNPSRLLINRTICNSDVTIDVDDKHVADGSHCCR